MVDLQGHQRLLLRPALQSLGEGLQSLLVAVQSVPKAAPTADLVRPLRQLKNLVVSYARNHPQMNLVEHAATSEAAELA